MEHTKGVWKAGPPATGIDPWIKRYVHAGGDLVAVVSAGYAPHFRLSESLEANANIIAAAPELLEALRSFPMLMVPAKTAWGKQVQEWQDTALAAIAKAEGR